MTTWISVRVQNEDEADTNRCARYLFDAMERAVGSMRVDHFTVVSLINDEGETVKRIILDPPKS